MANIIKAFLGIPEEPPNQRITPAQQAIADRVREAATKAEGAIRLGEHIVDGLTDFDGHCRQLAGSDPRLNMVMAEIEAETIDQVKKIQRHLYSKWDMP